jgi:ABC-type glutathione transport system ATPase component
MTLFSSIELKIIVIHLPHLLQRFITVVALFFAAIHVSTRSEIKKLQQERGTTTIFVTHDREEAMVLSDRIAIMQSGTLQQFANAPRSTTTPSTSSSPASSAAPK